MSEPPTVPPAPDDVSQIDPDALKRWFAIPRDKTVAIIATREEFDQLFLGLRQMTFAQGNTLAAFQQYTLGNAEQASSSFDLAVEQHRDAMASLTRFTSVVMAKAEPYER